ncbi:MAG: TonB-dependent receptor [Bacteroidota bacterium]
MKKKLLLLTFALFFACVSHVFGQSGTIKGVITDANEGSTLPGATISIEGTTVGTVTDVDGVYILTGVPAGNQTISISFLGFETKTVAIDMQDGQTLEISEALGEGAIMGEEVIVTGQLLGQAKAINRQLNSESIANIVSADKIQELPDVNAAEAISRLPGIAINRSGGEGQKVVIRGMEPKFAAITVNGVRLPASSSTDRSVDLSLLSPEMLDGIEVFKSPLPDMDAEAIGGTVNLSLRRAPRELKLLAKVLGGYNELNDDYGDYKAVLQGSKRFLNDKLGVVAQGTIERFNRGGDIINYSWSQGRTDPETGITEILGNSLTFEDRQEKRRRYNGSLSLDYDLGEGHKLGFFGLYSKTRRDRFEMSNIYNPGEPGITYRGRGIDNDLTLYTGSLSGEHSWGKLLVDWSISSSKTEGSTPYDFSMQFNDNISNPFDVGLNAMGHPRTFFAAATPNLQESFLRRNNLQATSTIEETQTAMVNLRIPLAINDKIGGYFKFGGKYFQADRSRVRTLRSENFYYLGGEFTKNAAAEFGTPLIRIPTNNSLISIQNFLGEADRVAFELEDGTPSDFTATLDPDIIRNWSIIQNPLLNDDRAAIVDNYTLTETITAGYAMLKLNLGKRLSVIPGFRYEYSDNDYSSGVSSINGRYGVNGFLIDTTTIQQYGEFLPHLHIKLQATDWFDIRASYATTLARPDYTYVTPRAQINNTSTRIQAGNPNLRHAKAVNYDLFLSAYKGGLGLLTIGGFYKDVNDVFIPRTIQLVDPALAAENGWPNNSGYELQSFANLDESKVYGYEIDLQTNLSFLPGLFKGFVFNLNYARLYSETRVFFLTSESVLISPFPPIFETTYTTNIREVQMPSQAPHIFNMSIGYDYKKFSARVSGSYQGTKARSYNLNKDFDQFDQGFWRWDASVKQRFGKNWSAFLNINNFTNQQDISFIRNEDFLRRIETFGMTGTIGVQYKL